VGVVEAAQLSLGLPLRSDGDGELIGNLSQGQRTGALGALATAADVHPNGHDDPDPDQHGHGPPRVVLDPPQRPWPWFLLGRCGVGGEADQPANEGRGADQHCLGEANASHVPILS